MAWDLGNCMDLASYDSRDEAESAAIDLHEYLGSNWTVVRHELHYHVISKGMKS
jgi:hypothetical protein